MKTYKIKVKTFIIFKTIYLYRKIQITSKILLDISNIIMTKIHHINILFL